MEETTVIIIAHNEAEKVKICIQSLRMYGGVDDLNTVVADNHSSYELKDWADKQTDFTYIYFDEREERYGKIVNDVVEVLGITGDILIMTPDFLFTPGCIANMKKVLRQDKIGMVGPMSNSFSFSQEFAHAIDHYEEAVNYADNLNAGYQMAAKLEAAAFMIRSSVLNQIGKFDEQFELMGCTVFDYFLRGICHDIGIAICQDSLLYCFVSNARSENCDFLNGNDKEKIREKWNMHYFNGDCNYELIKMIDRADKNAPVSVLEIGCDCGINLLSIRNQYRNAKLYGLEINESAAEIAEHLIGNVVVGNIEAENMPFEEKMFDYIVFGDVLEHLHHPQKTLEYCSKFLAPGGCILASIPNLMHISVWRQLLKGNFTYTELGLLDRTHIHLFTFNEIKRMFGEAGFLLQKVIVKSLPLDAQEEELIEKIMPLTEGVDRFMLETFQYIVRAGINEV